MVQIGAQSDRQSSISIGKRATTGALWIAAEMIVVQITSFAVFTVLAHFLVPADFGVVAVVVTIVYSIKAILIDQTLSPITRKALPTQEDWSTAFWIIMGVGLSISALLLLVSLQIDNWLRSERIGEVIRPMTLILVSLCIGQTQEAWLIRNFHFKTLALRSIIGCLIGSVAGIAAAILQLGIWALVLQQIVTSFCALGLLWLSTPWRPSFAFSKPVAKDIFGYWIGIGPSVTINLFNQNADTALLAYFLGPNTVGVYALAKRQFSLRHL